jgi:geranylgeranyl diphosphate synthase, type II
MSPVTEAPMPSSRELVRRIDARLAALTGQGTQCRVTEAMRYSLLAPGKRIRPILTLLLARQLGGNESLALDPACALEMVHSASLILDDLPAMDNATLRRGLPALHIAFGEATAQLAAIGLLNAAYQVVLRAEGLTPALRLGLLEDLTAAVGVDGLVGGQELDLQGQAQRLTADAVAKLNHGKTGVLFETAAMFGARIANIPATRREAARRFGDHLGQAFQIWDDLLDKQSSTAVIGKNIDQDGGEKSILATLSAEQARALMHQHHGEARTALAACGMNESALDLLLETIRHGLPPLQDGRADHVTTH